MNSLTNNFASLRYCFSFLFKDESSTQSCSAAISIYAELKRRSHQIWCCGAQHFPPFTVRPPADLLWHRLIWGLKLSPSQLFGCSSSHHSLAANHVSPIPDTSNCTTQHHTMGAVMPANWDWPATQPCQVSTLRQIRCECSHKEKSTSKYRVDTFSFAFGNIHIVPAYKIIDKYLNKKKVSLEDKKYSRWDVLDLLVHEIL